MLVRIVARVAGFVVGFALGVACAWAAVGDLGRSTSGLGGRALLVTTAFALLVFAPEDTNLVMARLELEQFIVASQFLAVQRTP